MRASSDHQNGFRRYHEAGNEFVPQADVQIVTSDGHSIPAHSGVLASASPVLERMLDLSRKGCNSERIIHILGAPHDAVLLFVQFLYSSRSAMSSREAEEAMQQHGMALLALSHAYRVPWLKRRCEAGMGARLSPARAMDALKLARLCDAPRLFRRCMGLVAKDFVAVQQTEGWRFVQKHDPALELEVLRLLQEVEQRKKRWRRERADQEMYRQLGEAMDCLKHICTEGVGSCSKSKGPCTCTSSSTCQGLQLLIRHFAACGRKLTPKGCNHCKRMWQLLQLHSSLCDHSDSCTVPLCMQFKVEMQMDKTWRLLVKKVATARVMSSLANRKVPEVVQKSWLRCKGTR